MRNVFTRTLLFAGACLGLTGTLLYADDTPKLDRNGLVTTSTRAIVSGESAYVLGPVETVTDILRLDKLVASPDRGAALIAVQKSRPYSGVALTQADVEAGAAQRPPELDLIYWDVRTRTAKTLLRETVAPETFREISGIWWLPETRIALVTVTRAEPDGTSTLSLMRVDGGAGTIRRVASLEPSSEIEVSPTRPLAYIESASEQVVDGKQEVFRTLQAYTPQGLGRTVRLDVGTGGLQWTLDGKSVYATWVSVRTPEGKRERRKLVTLVNLTTGVVTHPEKLPTVKDNPASTTDSPGDDWRAAIALVTTRITFAGPGGQAQETDALWIQAANAPKAPPKPGDVAPAVTPPPSSNRTATGALLVATNAKVEGYLASGDTLVILFTRDNALCAAPVFRLTKAELEQGIRRAQRDATVSNAKQVGLAIMMYVQDWDENYPMPGQGVAKSIEPYVKSKTLFNNPATGAPGFVYTHGGSTALAEMAEPATTQLGYLSGPGGRAIIWADGHITWQDDSAKP